MRTANCSPLASPAIRDPVLGIPAASTAGTRFAHVGGRLPQFTNPAGSRPQLPEQGSTDCFTRALTQRFSKESQSDPGLDRFHPSYRGGGGGCPQVALATLG